MLYMQNLNKDTNISWFIYHTEGVRAGTYSSITKTFTKICPISLIARCVRAVPLLFSYYRFLFLSL